MVGGSVSLRNLTVMNAPIPFAHAARLPEPGDNVAIATRTLEAGCQVLMESGPATIPHTVLEGHRFAVRPIGAGANLLSWGLPFGIASKSVQPGDYMCNEKILKALGERHVPFRLPPEPNFRDFRAPFALDEKAFRPGQQVAPHPHPATFQGYLRPSDRGVGTRNFVVVLGTTSLTGSFAKAVADLFKNVQTTHPHIDGVVAIAHTEGGGPNRPNNYELLLRTLSGLLWNPNVAAFLAVDHGTEQVTNTLLREAMLAQGRDLDSLPHVFQSIRGDHDSALREAMAAVRSLLDPANACRRTAQSVAHLKFGLQCGGSDAFSGVSGNPLIGWLSRELVRHGGAANLAETDELIGAEPYVLANVRDLATAQSFLQKIARFQEWAGWHGHSAEGNPSGGNNYRGLYNIVIKSIGAARKKAPDVRLDRVIDYGDPMPEPGYYFMDSPGNDLESIAGQVASGCNMILFSTGNGSITNFPYVPTIKIMTTTARFNLLPNEMDFNAGRYQDGESIEALGAEAFRLALEVASGMASAGEKAGHSQTQIWRDWRQTGPRSADKLVGDERATERADKSARAPEQQLEPISPEEERLASDFHFNGFQTPRGPVSDRVGLIVPTSLCAGQIGLMIANRLNAAGARGFSRFVALAHTEGCGNSGGYSEKLLLQTMAGYVAHPLAAKVLLLEHGCEKTHNDALRNCLERLGVDLAPLGWASVQMDGGLEKVSAKVAAWFGNAQAEAVPATAGIQDLRLGIATYGAVPAEAAALFSRLTRLIVSRGGTVVVPMNSELLRAPAFAGLAQTQPALEYGQAFTTPGLQLMETPTDHHVETLTGLGATGVEILLVLATRPPLQSHPMLPTLHVGLPCAEPGAWRRDLDLVLDSAPTVALAQLLDLVAAIASRRAIPRVSWKTFADFQMTRGLEGVSL